MTTQLTAPRSTAAGLVTVPGRRPPGASPDPDSTPSSTAAAPGRRSCPARTPRRTRTASTPGSASSAPPTPSSSTWSSAPSTPPGSSTGPTAPRRLASWPGPPRRTPARPGRSPGWGSNSSASPPAPSARPRLPTRPATTRGPSLSWPLDPIYSGYPSHRVAALEATAVGRSWLRDRWLDLARILEQGRTWQPMDRVRAIRLLGKQPLDFVADEQVLSIYLACHAMDPDGPDVFAEPLSDLSRPAVAGQASAADGEVPGIARGSGAEGCVRGPGGAGGDHRRGVGAPGGAAGGARRRRSRRRTSRRG